jgi:hypothetical protein
MRGRRPSALALLVVVLVVAGLGTVGIRPASATGAPAPPTLTGEAVSASGPAGNDLFVNCYPDSPGERLSIGVRDAGAGPYPGNFEARVSGVFDAPGAPGLSDFRMPFSVESSIGKVEGIVTVADGAHPGTCNDNDANLHFSGATYSARIYAADGGEYADTGAADLAVSGSGLGGPTVDFSLSFSSSGSAPSVAEPRTLSDEQLVVSQNEQKNGHVSLAAMCSPTATSTVSFTADGVNGPEAGGLGYAAYPGSFSSHGSAAFGPTPEGHYGHISSLDLHFSIASARGTVEGTITPGGTPEFPGTFGAYCFSEQSTPGAPAGIVMDEGYTVYTATITKPDGRIYHDEGAVFGGVGGSTSSPDSGQEHHLYLRSALAHPTPVAPPDPNPPTITISRPLPDERLALGQVVDSSFLCTDLESGVAGCSATVNPGNLADVTAIPTDTAGTFTMTVNGQDNAGNHASSSVTYEVVAGSASSTVPPSGTVSTGTTATPNEPVQTSIKSPSTPGDRTITIVPGNVEDPAAGDFTLFDKQVAIHAPPATSVDPYEVSFTVDASALNGIQPADVQIFRNGNLVADCTDPAGHVATPDPCVVSKGPAPSGGGDALVVARTSEFSLWTLGKRAHPIGQPDRYTTWQAATLTVPARGVLVNDVGIKGTDVLRADIVHGAAHGAVVVAPNGGFTYTPTSGFAGTDTFSYRATNVANASETTPVPITVTVDVTPRAATSITIYNLVVSSGPKAVPLAVGATLKSGSAALNGRTVYFTTTNGNEICHATTNSTGYATCNPALSAVSAILAQGYRSTFRGDAQYLPTTTGVNGLLPLLTLS